MSNENWNDPANPPSQPQPPNGQPSAPDPQAPPAEPAPEGTGSYTPPTYSTPSYTPPTYGTPESSQPESPESGSPDYSAPGSTPAYGSTPGYGSTEPITPAFGSTPSYGSTPYGSTPGSYGAAPEAPAGSGYTDPNQGYGATGGYGQSQPGQYGASQYGQPTQGYQEPPAYGTPPAPTYGAGYPSSGAVSAYGYDAGYANPAPQLATFGNRALGWLIDWVAPAVVGGMVGSMIGGVAHSSAVGSLFQFVLTAGFILWNSGYQAGITGYSLGRKVSKTKLVSEATGQPIGSGQGILRAGSQYVMNLLCGIVGAISWLFPLWDSKRQTLADKIVKSVVIADPNAGQAPLQ